MTESSLFAQRLQAVMERRRLQERILTTRRELKEERLRFQRLKRKSLRDRWLMEGMSALTDDSDHVPSVLEAQTRIQELEDDLSSLQSQMQQLDNPEPQLGPQQAEESAKAMKETQQSLQDGTAEVPLISSSSPQGRNSPESRLELAPVPSERPEEEEAKEKLQNGDMSGDGRNSPESRLELAPVPPERPEEEEAKEKLQDGDMSGDGRSSPESRLELAPVPSERPEKEEAKEKLQNGDMSGDGRSSPESRLELVPVPSERPEEEEAKEKLQDGDMSGDGRSSPESRLELAPVPSERPEEEEAKEKLQKGDMSGDGRSSPESRLELAPVPSERPEEEEAKEKLQNGDMSGDGVFGSECSPEQVNVAFESGDLQPNQEDSEVSPAPPLQSPNPAEASPSHHRKLAVEEMVIRDHLGQEVGSMDAVGQKQSCWAETDAVGQKEKLKEEETEEPSPLRNGCEEGSGPAQAQETSATTSASQLDCELGSREGPEGESPTSQEENQQNPSNQGQDVTSCLDSSEQQAGGELGRETALVGAEQTELPGQGASPAVSDALAESSITSRQSAEENRELPASHEAVLGQGGEGLSTEPLLPDQTSPVPEAQAPTTSGEDLLDQIPSSFQEMEGPLLEPVVSSLDQIPSPVKEISVEVVYQTQIPSLPDNIIQGQAPSSSPETPEQILLGQTNQEGKGGGDANLSSTTAEETPEVLGDLHAEQQPLLNATNASVAPPEIPLGDPQLSKTGILKSQAAPSQETPTSTTASANTASSRQLQPTESRQEEGKDQGKSRRKRKSCKCCCVM